jgi:glutaminyl-peptide cyclotransferase
MSPYPDSLSQISLFVLLDLLGSANPQIPSYFPTTHWVHKRIADIESRMRKLGLLESKPLFPFLSESGKTATQAGRTLVTDDHVPFMDRGVPVLHLLPSSLTPVWHTIDDDGNHLEMPTVRDWAKIMAAFALEWLDMMEVWPTE